MVGYKHERSKITRGWDVGEDGWGPPTNELLQQLAYIGTQPIIKGRLSAAPSEPADGDIYIVGASPTGVWSSFTANNLVIYGRSLIDYSMLQWQQIVPLEGWIFYRTDSNRLVSYNGSAWHDVGNNKFRGTWIADNFTVGDFVWHAGNFYICKVNRHSTDTSNPAADTTGWLNLTATGFSSTYKGSWHAAQYSVGDVVLYSNNFYRTRVNKTTANTTPPTQDGDWLLTSASGSHNDHYHGAWSIDNYAVGSVVNYSNKFYINKTARTTTDTLTPDRDPEWLDMVGTGAIAGGGYRGAWSPGIYAVGDMVSQLVNNSILVFYICNVARTAANTQNPVIDTASWGVVNFDMKFVTSSITSVDDNDTILIGDTSAGPTNRENRAIRFGIFKTLVSGSNYKGNWQAGTYAVGNIVRSGAAFFICQLARTASDVTPPGTDTAGWLPIGGELSSFFTVLTATQYSELSTFSANHLYAIIGAGTSGTDTGAGQLNVQSDFAETDMMSDAFIKNKPETIYCAARFAPGGLTAVTTASRNLALVFDYLNNQALASARNIQITIAGNVVYKNTWTLPSAGSPSNGILYFSLIRNVQDNIFNNDRTYGVTQVLIEFFRDGFQLTDFIGRAFAYLGVGSDFFDWGG